MRYLARTFGLFTLMILMFVSVGYVIGYFFMGNWIVGSLMFLAFAAFFNIIAYFYSHKFILRAYRARIIDESEDPRLYGLVKSVAFAADIPMPKVAIVPTSTPNAFATGRNKENAVVAVTEGILNMLKEDELKGVIAHEVAHIKNRDMMIMSVAATLAGAIAFMSRMVWFSMIFGRRRVHPVLLLTMILAPIAAVLVKLAISRKREYFADEEGARICKNPNALASALEKLHYQNSRNPMKGGNPESSSLFIINPFPRSFFVNMFSTHPPAEKRIERLRDMASDYSYL